MLNLWRAEQADPPPFVSDTAANEYSTSPGMEAHSGAAKPSDARPSRPPIWQLDEGGCRHAFRPSDWDRGVFFEYVGPYRYGSRAGSMARERMEPICAMGLTRRGKR